MSKMGTHVFEQQEKCTDFFMDDRESYHSSIQPIRDIIERAKMGCATSDEWEQIEKACGVFEKSKNSPIDF